MLKLQEVSSKKMGTKNENITNTTPPPSKNRKATMTKFKPMIYKTAEEAREGIEAFVAESFGGGLICVDPSDDTIWCQDKDWHPRDEVDMKEEEGR